MPPDAASIAPRPTRENAGGEIRPVVLYEDAAGRLIVVDAQRRAALAQDAGPLLRIGRARVVLRHLTGPVAARLAQDGHATVEGPDALNVLLAFASRLDRHPPAALSDAPGVPSRRPAPRAARAR
ncbi:MAG: hypothetical protein ACOY37_13565 [Pseudomonadota bacterium]